MRVVIDCVVFLCVCVRVCSEEDVIDACSFRDEDDDCTYEYTVDYPADASSKELEVQVLKKKGETTSLPHYCVFINNSGFVNGRGLGRAQW